MQELLSTAETAARYSRCIAASQQARFDIDKDVIRGRTFDFDHKFLPDGLSLVHELESLDAGERRLCSQIQGRTYANLFGLVERFIAAKTLEIAREHGLGDQVALEAMVRFTDEEIKHQELFRRVERMIGDGMPAGYRFLPEPNAVAAAVLGASDWAVLGLVCHIELFVLAHYRESIADDAQLSPLWKDVFLHHWREEAVHAVLDEIEWARADEALTGEARERAVDDLIALVSAVDGILQEQARADADYFLAVNERTLPLESREAVRTKFLKAYRWQYIGSGVRGRFAGVLAGKLTPAQLGRVQAALQPLLT